MTLGDFAFNTTRSLSLVIFWGEILIYFLAFLPSVRACVTPPPAAAVGPTDIARWEVFLSIYITYSSVSISTTLAVTGPHGQLASCIFHNCSWHYPHPMWRGAWFQFQCSFNCVVIVSLLWCPCNELLYDLFTQPCLINPLRWRLPHLKTRPNNIRNFFPNK